MTCTTSSALGRAARPSFLSPRFTLLLTLAGLLSCGSNAAKPAAATPNLSGDWGVYSTSSSSSFGVAAFVGNLQFDNGSVSGTLRPLTGVNSSCVEQVASANVQGTVDAANNLSLTVPISTGVAAITAIIPANPQTYIYGFYQIVGGGTCSMSATPMVISQFAPATGTYNGTLTVLDSTGAPVTGSSVKFSAVLTQSAFPDIYGQFMLTGTVTASGACNETIALRNSAAIGGIVVSQLFYGNLDPVSDTISDAVFQDPFPTDPNCGQPYQGTLTRQ